MSEIRDDKELAVQQELLHLVEGIVDGWRRKLLPHNPRNFALYAEGAIEQAEKLRLEIDEYLARKPKSVAESPAAQGAPHHPPAPAA